MCQVLGLTPGQAQWSAPLTSHGVEGPGCGWGGLGLELWLGWMADVSSNASELPPPMAVQPGQGTESFHAAEKGWR